MNRRELLKLGIGTASLPSLMGGQEAHSSAGGEKSEEALLAERAALFRELILNVAMGPGGLIIAFLDFDTRRPFQEDAELHWWLVRNFDRTAGREWRRPTTAEWYYGENTLWVEGWLLYSQILRYRVTKEKEALETARKCFRDLNHVFRMSSDIEPGLLGKPHGGRAGETTSYDQSACPILPYTMFAQELGTPEEKAEAERNMRLHGEYYLNRNWVMNHHGHLQRIVDPCHTSTMKYLACVYAAYQLTGETKFRDAAFKYMNQIIQEGKLPWPSAVYGIDHNPFYWGFLCDFWSKTEIGHEFDWTDCIRQYWQAYKSSLGEDGLPLLGPYDTVRRVATPLPEKWVPEEKSWQSPTTQRADVIPFAACCALLARSHGLNAAS